MDDLKVFFADYIVQLIDSDGEISRDGRAVEVSMVRPMGDGTVNVEVSEFDEDGEPTTPRPVRFKITLSEV